MRHDQERPLSKEDLLGLRSVDRMPPELAAKFAALERQRRARSRHYLATVEWTILVLGLIIFAVWLILR